MRQWSWTFALPEGAGADDEAPLFLRIARAIGDDIRRGRLRPGEALPGSRELARALGVHRNTVIASYRELVAEGWLTTETARGTFVSRALPDPSPRRFAKSAPSRDAMPARLGFDLVADPGPPFAPAEAPLAAGTLSMLGGSPDVRLAPTAALSRAYRRALRTSARALLSYGDARGDGSLRRALAGMLSRTRGLAATDDTVLVTRGSQMALDLLARALIGEGGVVAVEALGYRQAWEAFRLSGARVVPVPLDEGGLSVRALSQLVARGGVRAVYLTPHHQYPTTVTLTAPRRLELIELARKHRFAVLEDDYDHEFHYDGRPVLPMASADESGVVVYLGTLSKVLAPGLRVGYVVAPQPLLVRLAAMRRYVDRQGDLAMEHAVAELLEDGEVARHARRARRVYAERRNVLVELLREKLGDVVSFAVPAGGTAIWARVRGVEPEGWAARARDRGVLIQVGRQFAFDGRARSFVRLGFAQLTPSETREAVKRLTAAV